jgi:hypothetical protein
MYLFEVARLMPVDFSQSLRRRRFFTVPVAFDL